MAASPQAGGAAAKLLLMVILFTLVIGTYADPGSGTVRNVAVASLVSAIAVVGHWIVVIYVRTSPRTDNDGYSQLWRNGGVFKFLQRFFEDKGCTFSLHPRVFVAEEVARKGTHESVETAQVINAVKSMPQGSNVMILATDAQRLGETEAQVANFEQELAAVKGRNAMILTGAEALVDPKKSAGANETYSKTRSAIFTRFSHKNAGKEVPVTSDHRLRKLVEEKQPEVRTALLTLNSEYNRKLDSATRGSTLPDDAALTKYLQEQISRIDKLKSEEARQKELLACKQHLLETYSSCASAKRDDDKLDVGIYCRSSPGKDTEMVQGYPLEQISWILPHLEVKYNGLDKLNLTVFFDDDKLRTSLCNPEMGKCWKFVLANKPDLLLAANPARHSDRLVSVALMKGCVPYEFSQNIGQDWEKVAKAEETRYSLLDAATTTRNNTIAELRDALHPTDRAFSVSVNDIVSTHFSSSEHTELMSVMEDWSDVLIQKMQERYGADFYHHLNTILEREELLCNSLGLPGVESRDDFNQKGGRITPKMRSFGVDDLICNMKNHEKVQNSDQSNLQDVKTAFERIFHDKLEAEIEGAVIGKADMKAQILRDFAIGAKIHFEKMEVLDAHHVEIVVAQEGGWRRHQILTIKDGKIIKIAAVEDGSGTKDVPRKACGAPPPHLVASQ